MKIVLLYTECYQKLLWVAIYIFFCSIYRSPGVSCLRYHPNKVFLNKIKTLKLQSFFFELTDSLPHATSTIWKRNLSSFHNYLYSFKPLHCIILCFSAEKDASVIRIYDGRGTKEPLKVLDNLHESPVSIIRVNTLQSVSISHTQNVPYFLTFTSLSCSCIA